MFRGFAKIFHLILSVSRSGRVFQNIALSLNKKIFPISLPFTHRFYYVKSDTVRFNVRSVIELEKTPDIINFKFSI